MDAKTYDGITARFIASVATCMPKLQAGVMQTWIDNPAALKKTLLGALCPPQFVAEALPVWKTVVLGFHKSYEKYQEAFKRARCEIARFTPEVMKHIDIASSRTELDLVVRQVSDFGFDQSEVRYDEICSAALASGFELCPAEVALALPLGFAISDLGNDLFIAMQSLPDSVGLPNIFRLTLFEGKIQLDWNDGRPKTLFARNERFVFVRPRI